MGYFADRELETPSWNTYAAFCELRVAACRDDESSEKITSTFRASETIRGFAVCDSCSNTTVFY